MGSGPVHEVSISGNNTFGQLGFAYSCTLLIDANVGTARQVGRADSENVWACDREVGVESLAIGTKAVSNVGATASSNSGVTGRDNDSDALHGKLHDLIALTALICGWKIGFLRTVGNRDDVRRLSVVSAYALCLFAAGFICGITYPVFAALKLALVSAGSRIGVWRVQWGVASLAKCRVRAV